MSNFNVENDMQYLAEMSDDEKIIFLKVLTRLARADGKLDDNERDFIREIAGGLQCSCQSVRRNYQCQQ